jgi:uncharacterized membrane protein
MIFSAVNLLAGFFLLAGVMHFVVPTFYLGIVPPWLSHPLALVYVSGLFEICGGLGVLAKPLRRAAGLGLVALLVAVFPANVQMALHARDVHAPLLAFLGLAFVRLPIQSLLIIWVWRVTQTGMTSPTPNLHINDNGVN